MKKLTYIVGCILLQISLVNCQTKEEVISYEVTPEFAEKIDKPAVHFKADIPKDLKFDRPKEGQKNSSYGMIQKFDKDSIVTEMCSFGYIKLDGLALDKEGISFMKQIKNMLRTGGYEFDNSQLGLLDFDGEKRIGLQLVGKMKEGISDTYVGKYRFNIVTRENPNGNTHIIFLMAAKDEDESLSFEDFKDKLAISKVWQSFQYVN